MKLVLLHLALLAVAQGSPTANRTEEVDLCPDKEEATEAPRAEVVDADGIDTGESIEDIVDESDCAVKIYEISMCTTGDYKDCYFDMVAFCKDKGMKIWAPISREKMIEDMECAGIKRKNTNVALGWNDGDKNKDVWRDNEGNELPSGAENSIWSAGSPNNYVRGTSYCSYLTLSNLEVRAKLCLIIQQLQFEYMVCEKLNAELVEDEGEETGGVTGQLVDQTDCGAVKFYESSDCAGEPCFLHTRQTSCQDKGMKMWAPVSREKMIEDMECAGIKFADDTWFAFGWNDLDEEGVWRDSEGNELPSGAENDIWSPDYPRLDLTRGCAYLWLRTVGEHIVMDDSCLSITNHTYIVCEKLNAELVEDEGGETGGVPGQLVDQTVLR